MLDLEREQRYREALYALLERSKATRAALYLIEPTGEFRLAAHYGYSPRDMPRLQFGKDDALVRAVNRFRQPFFLNSPAESEDLGPEMERSRTARLLVAPMYRDGRLSGIIEARDKVAGGRYDAEDLHIASEVTAVLLRLHREIRGHRDSTEDVTVPAEAPNPQIESISPALSQREALLFRGFATALLLDPSVRAVAFSLWLEEAIEVYAAARGPVEDDLLDAVIESAAEIFGRIAPGSPRPGQRRARRELLHGGAGPPVRRGDIAAAQSSAVFSEEGRALFFTLAYSEEPAGERAAAALQVHALVRRALAETRNAIRYRGAYRSLIRKFLEPGLKKHAALVSHSLAVGRLARRFAARLELPEAAVEQITVAALLHDVGLRELAYDRLSEKRTLSESEYELARDHPAVGALLLSEVEFPYPVGPLVRHHHERYDGAGYPDRLHGEQIPFGSRLIHIVEAYDAMTSSSSYRPTISRAEALDVVVSKAGTQFDPDLAIRFRDLMVAGEIDRA
jgi:putative nucleotidyltransferase with HDIG domain